MVVGADHSVVRVSGLTHRYRKLLALTVDSLEIPTGRRVGMIGPDGVGKSTLMGLLAGARQIQSGRIEVLGRDIRERRNRSEVVHRLAYMPQGLGKNLYADLSIRENLSFFGRLFGQQRDQRERTIKRLTKATGLAPFLDRPAGKLSGGMKQKLGL